MAKDRGETLRPFIHTHTHTHQHTHRHTHTHTPTHTQTHTHTHTHTHTYKQTHTSFGQGLLMQPALSKKGILDIDNFKNIIF